MASRLKITGVILLIIGIVSWGAAGYAYTRYQSGQDALQGFSEAQNVQLSYNEDGNLVDRGTEDGAKAILELLGETWAWPIVEGELDPSDPVVNTATEYMFQMATIGQHTLHGTQTVVLTERVEWDGDGDGTVTAPAESAMPDESEAPAESAAPAESVAPAEAVAPAESVAPAEASAAPDEPVESAAPTAVVAATVYSGGEWDPATMGEDAIFNPGVYEVPVAGRYWEGFNRMHPLDGPARGQAWNGTVHGLFAQLGVGAVTATSLQMAQGIVGVTLLMGLGFVVSGGGLLWAGMGVKKEEKPKKDAATA